MEARLPQHKLDKIRDLLNKYLVRSKIKLREIQSLVGVLNFACSVVVPGRCFYAASSPCPKASADHTTG